MKNIPVQPDQHTIQIYQNQLQIEAHASEIIMEKMKEINQEIQRSPVTKGKYSKRRRSNVAVIIVRVIFISS